MGGVRGGGFGEVRMIGSLGQFHHGVGGADPCRGQADIIAQWVLLVLALLAGGNARQAG